MTKENTAVAMTTVLLYLTSCSCSSAGEETTTSLPLPVSCTYDEQPDDQGGWISLSVDCQASNQNESEQTGAIEALLSTNASQLQVLRISNSKLSKLPTKICSLRALRHLYLDQNQLTELPRDCINQLPELITLSANENRIGRLQDGLFRGMEKLESLSFKSNSIESIGLNLFSNKSDLPRLSWIDLSFNRLTVLEPWPFIRGQVRSGVDVVLTRNSISRFTNEIGWRFACGMKPFALQLDLGLNNISRFTDFTEGFNLTKLVTILCLYQSKSHSPMKIELYGNPINCDCHLFKFAAIARNFQYANFLNDLNCAAPFDLVNQKVISVMAEPHKFVCDVQEMCPVNCRCTQVPAELSMVVRTVGIVQELPVELPPLKTNKYAYVLNFTHSSIRAVTSRPYLQNSTKVIDLSKSTVERITDEAWRDLATVATIHLHSNRLRTLSPVVNDLDFAFKTLSLHGNPLSCDCENKWLKTWLVKYKERLESPDSIVCATPQWLSGRMVMGVEDSENCNDPNTAKVTAIGVSIGLGTLVIVVLLGAFAFHRLRIYLFATFNIHPFDRDECEGEDVDYDVFLTCAHEDRSHALNVLRVLERNKYRVCYHEKDFRVGQTIADNICQSVIRSKRVLCLVSERFLRSSYCVYEFETALDHSEKIKRKRVVVILLEKIDVKGPGVPKELGRYLSSHTVVEYWVSNWTKNLLYALPTRPLGEDTAETGQSTLSNYSSDVSSVI